MKPLSHFSTFARFLQYVEHTDPTWSDPHSARDESGNDDPWSGTATFDGAMALAYNGWPEGRKFLTTIEHDTVALPNTVTITQKRSFDVVGGYPEIGLALSGDPEHMVTIEPTPVRSPILHIGVELFKEGQTPAHQIMQYGGIIVSYIDALEAAGWCCELTLSLNKKTMTPRAPVPWHASVILKQAEETPDKDRILFALANPAMSRRLFFRVLETFPNLEKHYKSNYGRPGTPPVSPFNIFIPRIKDKEHKNDMLSRINRAITNGVPTYA